jgi:hypothetical protein
MMSEWQDISTAPKDRRCLFAYDGDGIFLGEWSDYWQNFHPEDRPVELFDEGEGPTHWMPLPDPPK